MRWRLLVGLVVAGCGSDAPPQGEGESEGEGEGLLPLAVGASWTYDVTDLGTGEQSEKTTTVEAEEDVGGKMAGTTAFRVRTEKIDGTTMNWQKDIGDAIVRYHEEAYDLGDALTSDEWYEPYKLRIDESAAHTAEGATWDEEYTETHYEPGVPDPTVTARVNEWTVEAVADEIDVPAGTFTCLRLHRVGSEVGQADKTFWFARGVGKVKESGGQEELLVGYSLP